MSFGVDDVVVVGKLVKDGWKSRFFDLHHLQITEEEDSRTYSGSHTKTPWP